MEQAFRGWSPRLWRWVVLSGWRGPGAWIGMGMAKFSRPACAGSPSHKRGGKLGVARGRNRLYHPKSPLSLRAAKRRGDLPERSGSAVNRRFPRLLPQPGMTERRGVGSPQLRRVGRVFLTAEDPVGQCKSGPYSYVSLLLFHRRLTPPAGSFGMS
jgi:hypothetical protein